MSVYTEESGDGHRWTLRPNRSLGWLKAKALVLGLGACMTLFGAYWAAQGAWLVLPFFGLELLVLGLGFYLGALAGARREVVEIEGAEIRVLKGGRRIERVEHLPRWWTRVVLSRDPTGWYPSRLWLVCHGRRVELASALVEQERLALATELTERLGLRPSVFHRRPLPALTGTGAAAPAPQAKREGTWP
jgi:uncharacterized membrane protein